MEDIGDTLRMPLGKVEWGELYALASRLGKEGRFEEAEKAWHFIARHKEYVHPNYRGGAFFKLGEMESGFGNKDKARMYFKKCIQLIPHHWRAAVFLGLHQPVMDQWDQLLKVVAKHLPETDRDVFIRLEQLAENSFFIEPGEKKEVENLFHTISIQLEKAKDVRSAKDMALFLLRIISESTLLVERLMHLNLLKPPRFIEGDLLVSIVMPYYNGHETIRETLEGLANQTYRNFELVIGDDGSTAESQGQLKDILSGFPRLNVRVLHLDHMGQAPATNRAIEAAKGDFILPLDADDIIAHDYIERTINEFDKDPTLDVAYTETLLFGLENRLTVRKDFNAPDVFFRNQLNITSLIKSSVLRTFGPYCETLAGYEDWDLWITFAKKKCKFKRIPEPLFFYRKSTASRGFHSRNKDFLKRKMIMEHHHDIYRKPEPQEMYILEHNSAFIPPLFLISSQEESG